jgi:hypothetical protein
MSLKAGLSRWKRLLKDLPRQIALYATPTKKRKGVIFWGHLGLGDVISNASIIEHLLIDNRIVVIPTKKRNSDFLSSTFGTWDGVVIAQINDNSRWESLEILKLKLKFRFPIMVVGHDSLPADWDLQPISLNEQFQQLAGIPDTNLKSERFRKTCKNILQADVPKERYIFVDDHPGTEREIPQSILQEATQRGLKIIRNDVSVPLYRLLDILDNAQEIHVVASAPLCFALTAAAASQKKFYYRTKGQGPVASAAYPDWVDVDLR